MTHFYGIIYFKIQSRFSAMGVWVLFEQKCYWIKKILWGIVLIRNRNIKRYKKCLEITWKLNQCSETGVKNKRNVWKIISFISEWALKFLLKFNNYLISATISKTLYILLQLRRRKNKIFNQHFECAKKIIEIIN